MNNLEYTIEEDGTYSFYIGEEEVHECYTDFLYCFKEELNNGYN